VQKKNWRVDSNLQTYHLLHSEGRLSHRQISANSGARDFMVVVFDHNYVLVGDIVDRPLTNRVGLSS
jgi:hypothetical protein